MFRKPKQSNNAPSEMVYFFLFFFCFIEISISAPTFKGNGQNCTGLRSICFQFFAILTSVISLVSKDPRFLVDVLNLMSFRDINDKS